MVTMTQPSFHLFPKLPIELRQHIWYHALPAAAVVEIEFCTIATQWFCPVASLPPPCGLSNACAESRNMYVKYYNTKLYAGGREHEEVTQLGSCNHNLLDETNSADTGDEIIRRVVRVDLNIDTIYIGPNTQGELCFTYSSLQTLLAIPMIENLRRLAVEDLEWSNDLTTDPGELDALAFFKKLEKVSVLVGDISWISFVHRSKGPSERTKDVIEIEDCRNTEWLKRSVKRIERKWNQILEGPDVEVGFEFDVKMIRRGSEK
ncbi:uncharacterized protein LY89DRAFT_743120 [Mollisia scopiformis]|uniref:2EXR domain-containing protein n=1 Tax=Mollisia scopiformis TaxID=149040 RepID=A0A132B457_MOLSC|nr:uncharacterized protein LY89DRAFT_743120 [Mollisia scopiformis]KUJ07121.1 hypothetical protein LY89DRAFT_743120 [Mollisia scopiformis]